jgi:hypothetical protein
VVCREGVELVRRYVLNHMINGPSEERKRKIRRKKRRREKKFGLWQFSTQLK